VENLKNNKNNNLNNNREMEVKKMTKQINSKKVTAGGLLNTLLGLFRFL
jgi:hypothetical protein